MAVPYLALATLGAGVLGTAGQMSANSTNRAIAREQNAFNRQMMEEQNKWNLGQWHRQNAYNDPSAQRKRLEKAGINPAIALSSISTGQAESLTSAPAHPAAGAEVSNPMQPLADGITSSVNQYLQAKGLEASIRKTTADAEAVEIDNRYKERFNDEDYKGKQLDNAYKVSQKRHTDLSAKAIEEMLPLQKQELIARVTNTLSATRLNEIEQDLKLDELRNLRPEQRNLLRAQTRNYIQAAVYMVQQGEVAKAQLPLLAQEVNYRLAQTLNTESNTKSVEANTQYFLRNQHVMQNILVEEWKRAGLTNTQLEQEIKYRPHEEIRQNIGVFLKAVDTYTNYLSTMVDIGSKVAPMAGFGKMIPAAGAAPTGAKSLSAGTRHMLGSGR